MKNYSFFISLLMVMLLSVGNVWGADEIASGTFNGKEAIYTEGWSTTGTGKGRTDCIIIGSGENITSPSIDLSEYKSISITFTGRRYGTLTGSKATVAVAFAGSNIGSIDITNGSVGTVSGSVDWTIEGTKSGTFVFTCSNATSAGSIHGAGIGSITITGVKAGGDEPGGGEEPGGGDDPAPASDTYELVTNVSDLAVDDEIIIVNVADSKALSTTQNNSNRGAAAVTITNDAIVPGDDVQIITLGQTNEHWTLYTGNGYLYASSSSSNQLKTQATNNANGEWAISISDGVASVVAQGKNSRNVMQYNSGSAIFACYGTASQAVLAIFKKSDGTPQKPEAGLAYAAEDQKKLNKLGDVFTAPTLSNPNNLEGITYASNNTDVAEVDANGAVTIKAAGVAIITASFEGNDDYKAGSASYTIGVTSHTGTEADPYVAADAKIAIDVKGTVENAYATGIVCNIVTTDLPAEGYITFFFSADGATSGQQIEAYKCYGLNSDPFEALTDVKTGATVVVTGTLKKYNSTYEFDQNCHLVSYEAPAVQKTHIANTKETAYTVAQAIEYAADGVTYDLDDYVYVQGVVYAVKNFSKGTMDIFIKDANAENQFELYKCTGINDGTSTTPFDALSDVQVGNVVIGYGQLTVYNSVYEFKQGNYLVDLDRPTPTPPASNNVVILAEYNSKYYAMSTALSNSSCPAVEVERDGDNIVVTSAADRAAIQWSMDVDESASPKTASFQAGANEYLKGTSGGASLSFATTPFNWEWDETNNCYIVSGSTRGFFYKNDGVFKNYALSNLSNASYAGVEIIEINPANIVISSKVDPKLAYTPASATITIGGSWSAPELTYANGFDGLAAVTYASNNEAVATVTEAGVISLAGGTGTAVITAHFNGDATFNAGNATYTITVNAADPRNNAVSPAAFTTTSGNLNPADIAYASYKGGASTAPAIYNDGIRLYQAPSADKIGGYITLKAKKGCTIDQVKITTTNSYATTVAYSVDGNENLLGSESVAKASDYSTPSGLNVESVNIVNKGTESKGRLEIASIKVWYTGDPLDVDHYFLGGTYETTFEQNGTFDYTGLEVYASYDAGETITEPVEGFTVDADLSTAGDKKAEVYLNEVKIAEYDITVTAGKENPALAYSPASATITAGDAWSAPTLSNTFHVSPITYSSDKESVATVDENGVITLAGGYGTAVITAHFDETAAYVESEATYTITVNKPAPTPTTTVYRKVTAIEDITDGEYLIVYEGDDKHDAAVFDGSLDNVDQAMKVLAVEIENEKIAGNTDLDAATFTIDVTARSLQSASGWYIGKTDYANGMDKSTTEAYVNTFAITGGAAVITGAGGCKLRYNYANDQLRFRYYKSGQQAIQLYKKESAEPVVPEPDYTRSITAGQFGTICLPNSGRIEDATIFEIAHTKDGKIFFDEISEATMVAGRPYIFYPNNGASELKVYYTGSENAAAGTYNGLYGSYVQSQLAQNDGNYILYDNKYYLVDSEAYVGANRAYIKLGEVPTEEQAPAPGRRRVSMDVQGEQVATSIINTHYSDQPMKVMIDNQLYIIRAGQMFDMTGNKIK